MMRYDIYLAGPFFNDEQKRVMKIAKKHFTEQGFVVCDPQDLSPVIVDLPESERRESLFKGIFENNILAMDESSYLVACIDDRDTGTSFELGYFFSTKGRRSIFTFSAHNHGANVMLSQATSGHVGSLDDLSKISRLIRGEESNLQPLNSEE